MGDERGSDEYRATVICRNNVATNDAFPFYFTCIVELSQYSEIARFRLYTRRAMVWVLVGMGAQAQGRNLAWAAREGMYGDGCIFGWDRNS